MSFSISAPLIIVSAISWLYMLPFSSNFTYMPCIITFMQFFVLSSEDLGHFTRDFFSLTRNVYGIVFLYRATVAEQSAYRICMRFIYVAAKDIYKSPLNHYPFIKILYFSFDFYIRIHSTG